jgi:hypothetical protein
MAKDKITDYDSVASNNLDVGGISVAEGMLPSGVNNAMRELMSHQKEAFGSGTPLYVDQTNNRVGVNNAAPATALDVTGGLNTTGRVGIGGSETTVFNGIGGDMNLVVLGNDSTTTIGNNSNSGIAIVNTNHTAGTLAGLHFARADTDYTPNYAGASIVAQFPEAQVTGQYPKGDLAFLTSTTTNSAPSEKMRLTAAGNVGISKSAFGSISTDGFWWENGASKYLALSGTGTSPIYLNRNGSDGGIVNFYKSGTNVGAIGVGNTNRPYIGSGDTGIMFDANNNAIYPWNTTTNGVPASDQVDLGYDATGLKFKNLYLGGGVYLGGTGSANHLDSYEEGTWNPSVGGTATYTPANFGRYVKIGRIVTLNFTIAVSSIGTGATAGVQNLPFASENIGEVQTGCVSYFSGLTTATNFLAFYVHNNATTTGFVGNTGNNTTIALNGFGAIGNNTTIYCTITYRTAS